MVEPTAVKIVEIDVTDDDALGRWIAVHNAVHPRPLTVSGYRAETTAALGRIELLATLDGRDVGAATGGWGAILAESGETYLGVWVVPNARHQGIGTALADRAIDHARQHGMTTARASLAQGDEASLRFAAGYGLVQVAEGETGMLELRPEHASATAPLPDGVTLTSLEERPDLMRAVYDLDVVVQPEIPSLAEQPTPSFEAWQEQTAGDPGFLASLSVMAIRGDQVVGSIQIYDNAERTAFIGMAAVDPGARRLGIARALKVEVARRAVTSGWERIETFNDGSNARMRALNTELGYVYQHALIGVKGPLPPVDAAVAAG